MKKILLVLSLSFCTMASALAQDISTVFLSVPDAVITSLEIEQKVALTAQSNDTTKATVETPIYETITRTAFSDSYIALATSKVGTVQIKLLSLVNDSKVICVVKTVKGSMSDSQISFYTTKWNPIVPKELFPKPRLDWFVRSDADRQSQEYINAVAMADVLPVTLSISDSDSSISATLDLKSYLSIEDYKKLQPFLTNEPKVLTWDKTSYR